MIPCCDQRGRERLDRAEDQLRAVVGRDEPHALGQAQRARSRALIASITSSALRADAHHDDAADRLALAVPVRGAAPDLRAELHRATSRKPDRRAPGSDRDDALLEVRQRLDVAAAAQDVLASGHLEHARADLGVRVAHRARHVARARRRRRRAGSGSRTIWYCRSKPPSDATSATPATACSAGRTVKSCSARSSARSSLPDVSSSTY